MLRSSSDRARTSNASLRRLRLVAERPRHRVEQVGEEDLLGVDRHRAGFDLRQVEDVADQVQQVGAGAVDGAGELDLLVRQIAVGVVAQLLAEDQDAVERRAQLVGHVGEELGLVLRGQRQLGRLLFERAAGLLDFLVLALDLDVALGELLRLLLQLLVGLLQLLLLRLQLGGELLRLLQQAFGLHRRLDAVQHDADAGGQLLEERQVRRLEIVQRGERDHRLDLVFEHDRQDDEVARQGLEQARADRHRVRRDIGDQRCAASRAHWPIRPSPESQPGRDSRRVGRRRSWRAASGAALPSPPSPSGRSRPGGR